MLKLNRHIFGIFSEGKKTPNVTMAGALKLIFVRQTSQPQFTELFCVFQPQKLTIPQNPKNKRSHKIPLKPEIPPFPVHSFCRIQPSGNCEPYEKVESLASFALEMMKKPGSKAEFGGWIFFSWNGCGIFDGHWVWKVLPRPLPKKTGCFRG